MRKIAVLLLLVLVAVLVWWKIGQQQRATPSPQPTAVISPTSATPFCTSNDLQALLMLDHAAGNVYGRFTLKNTSDHQCQLPGGAFIEVQYSGVSTITVTHVERNAPESFVLAPQQTVYSQVHYPNGPQCSSMTKAVNVTFVYPLASGEDVFFLDQMGQQSQVVQTCASANESTENANLEYVRSANNGELIRACLKSQKRINFERFFVTSRREESSVSVDT